MVAAVRTVFAQPNRRAASQQLGVVVQAMESRWPRAARLLTEAEHDVLVYMALPVDHWTRIYSTNPLERLKRSNGGRMWWACSLANPQSNA